MAHGGESDDAFYDLCYEAWCRGENPDNVSRDRFDDCLYRGFYPDEIGLRDVLPREPNPTEQEEVKE